jgi:cyclopropane fatty-acyl-phospholipid synthase-like methyltransferase
MHDYRQRIYQHYVSARDQSLAPASIEGLRPRAPYLNKLIRNHFPSDKNAAVLELGCGHGALIYFAREAGYRNIIGVDRSPQQVAEARHLGIDEVREGDLMETLKTYADGSLDVVVAFDVIEHFTKDEILPFVDQVNRVLRPGGKWIIHAPNGESPFGGRMRYWDFTHEQAFTSASIAQLLKSSEFSEISCYEDAPIPHGPTSFVRWVLWKLIRSVMHLYLMAETGETSPHLFSQNFLAVAVK